MQRTLTTGLGIELRRSYDLSAIVHIDNLGGGRLLFTCIPLLYGPYGTTQGGSGFQLDPPKSVNLKAGLPLVSQVSVSRCRSPTGSVSSGDGQPGDGIGANQRQIAAQPGRLGTVRYSDPGRQALASLRSTPKPVVTPAGKTTFASGSGSQPVGSAEGFSGGHSHSDPGRSRGN